MLVTHDQQSNMILSMKQQPTLFARLRSNLRDFGLVNFFLYLLARLIDKLPGNWRMIKYYLIAQPIHKQSATKPVKRRSSVISIHKIDASEYRYDWFPRPKIIIESRYAQGAECLVAFQHGNAIGCLWFIHGQYAEDEVRCCFSPSPKEKVVWDFDVYVEPKYRLGRAFALLWEEADKLFESRSVEWTTSRIDAFNPQSIRSHKRLGAEILGSVVFLCMGKFQLMFSTRSPHISLTRKNGIPPKIVLNIPDVTV